MEWLAVPLEPELPETSSIQWILREREGSTDQPDPDGFIALDDTPGRYLLPRIRGEEPMRLALLSLPDFQKLALFCRTGVGIALVSDVHLSAGGLPLPDVPADFVVVAARVARPPWAMHVAGSRESCGRSDPALVVDLDENGGTGLPSAAAR